MNSYMMLQIPVQSCGNVYPRIASDDGLVTLLIQLKEVYVTFYLLNYEFLGGPSVDAFQQPIDGSSSR